MVDTEKLKFAISRNGMTQRTVAEALRVSPNTIYRKVHNLSKWWGIEIEVVCKLLNLDVESRNEIFFASHVDYKSTKKGG